jgi:nucleoside-diphosphate-sugar epimerase
MVTGAAGFIGSHLCERLLRDGHEVVGVDAMIPESYAREAKETNLTALRDHQGFTLQRLDLRVDPLEVALEGVDRVVHLAAMPGLPLSWERLDLYSSCNLLATGRLAEAATRAGVERVVFGSTSSVYGRFAVGDEQQPQRPSSPYGLTKLAAEHLLFAHAENFGLPVVVTRFFSIYGPRQRPDMAYHIFIEALLDDREIVVFGDGRQARSNTFVDDCVDGTVRALEAGRLGEVYNIGGGELVVLNDAIAMLEDLIGRRTRRRTLPGRPGDQQVTNADVTKISAELGYQPRTRPIDGLAAQLEWHRSRRKN